MTRDLFFPPRPCWNLFGTWAPTTNSSAGFYNSAPNSFGIDLNGVTLSAGSYAFASQSYSFFKPVFSFWLRTALTKSGEWLLLQWSLDGGTTYVAVPSSAISGCPYNGVNGWTGIQVMSNVFGSTFN